jgi:hypothetical protein
MSSLKHTENYANNLVITNSRFNTIHQSYNCQQENSLRTKVVAIILTISENYGWPIHPLQASILKIQSTQPRKQHHKDQWINNIYELVIYSKWTTLNQSEVHSYKWATYNSREVNFHFTANFTLQINGNNL